MVELLDCTLRDGGYSNNWTFGENTIHGLVHGLMASNIDIIELGFMRDELYSKDRSVFSSIDSACNILSSENNKNTIFSVMIEAFNPFPLIKLKRNTANRIDLVRVCIWKRLLDEHIEYCSRIKEKGFQITIQPSRVEQYSDEEFLHMLELINELDPFALYVVDTWGTQSSKQVMHYVCLADQYLKPQIRIGYHGHNNKMQALSCAQAILDMNLKRNICIDSSLLGMGRGAGNLHTEIIADYLNERIQSKYNYDLLIHLAGKYVKQFQNENGWGYSLYYNLSAKYGCNPNFAAYFQKNNLGEDLFVSFLSSLDEHEKIVFSSDFVKERLREFK